MGNINLEEPETRIGIMGRAVKIGQSQRVDDVTQDEDYIAYDPQTRSELAVPINIKRGTEEKTIGVINVEHADVAAFNDQDRLALEHLADQAAIAIDNAQTYEDLQRAKKLIAGRTAAAWMGLASSVWRHAIEGDAQIIADKAQLLLMDLQEASLPSPTLNVRERVEKIEEIAWKILHSPVTPALTLEDGARSVQLNGFIRNRARQLWRNSKAYSQAKLKLKLKLPGSATVWGSPIWLREAFDILVDNAVDAVEGQPVRDITIGTREAGANAEIFIKDTGTGIPPAILPKIGLDNIEKSEDAKGMGRGLLLAPIIMEAYGGKIYVASTGPSGTTMVMQLPLEM